MVSEAVVVEVFLTFGDWKAIVYRMDKDGSGDEEQDDISFLRTVLFFLAAEEWEGS